MFEQSMLELASTRRANRPLATAVSFVVQSMLLAILVLIPLMYTEGLPARELVTFLVAPAPPPPPPPPASTAVQKPRVVRRVQSDIAETGELKTPSRIPRKVQILKEEAPPPVLTAGGVVGGVPGGIPGGRIGGVIGGIIGSTPKAAYLSPPPKTTPKRVRVSQGVTRGLLVRKVKPAYPPIARQARIQGKVELQAIIAKDGTIQNLHAVSGHPMLVPAAIAAVKEWRYKPYLLNGIPVEVETQITVFFSLMG